MGFIIPSNKRNPVCNKYDVAPDSKFNATLSCSMFYERDRVTLKKYTNSTNVILPDAACLPLGEVYTGKGGQKVTGTGCNNKTCYESTFIKEANHKYNPDCTYNSVNTKDQIASKEWATAYRKWAKNPNKKNIPEPIGGCYIENSFPPCSSVDLFQQSISKEMDIIMNIYAGSGIFSTTTTDIINCLEVVVSNSFINDLVIDQSIIINKTNINNISSMVNSTFVASIGTIIESSLNIINETYLSGCVDRMPSPLPPQGLDASSITKIKDKITSDTFLDTIIDIVEDIHACNKTRVLINDTYASGTITIKQTVMYESYTKSIIDSVLIAALDVTELTTVTNNIQSSKTSRYSDEDILGKQDSNIPLTIIMSVTVMAVIVGIFFLIFKFSKPKSKKKDINKPIKW